MKAICVDDAALILDHTISQLKQINSIDAVEGFTHPTDALNYVKNNPVDIALLDIDMPDMNGIALAAKVKNIQPNCAVIFLTAYAEYALEAFAIHASGYLMKPVSLERLNDEIKYCISGAKPLPSSHITVRTFGNFDILVDGEVVSFGRSKSKELLAYLIDRNGASIKRAEAFSVLWEDGVYDYSMQKQLDVIIRSLRATLKNYGIGEIFELKKSTLRILPELIDCDLYRFLKGDTNAVSTYRGEYMNQYSWATLGEADLSRRFNELMD
ncbi:MAG: response regulator [Lachnospiraceae bacterium]|nr:response regulator [Lachnospiraceae bacterium]MBP5413865.1 response regulator [Lachnospiraceae bacterium]MBP5746444.1 response regulator [Lachnospiraceae bacterium]